MTNRLGVDGAVGGLGREDLGAGDQIGDRAQRVVGQFQVGLGEVRVLLIDFGQPLRAVQRAQARRGDGIVRRAREALAGADLPLQVVCFGAQAGDLPGGLLVEGAGAEADHRVLTLSR